MSDHEVKMVILSTDDLDESIRFYSETLGMPLKFRDGAHFAALDGGPVTLALATPVDHPIPGQVVVGIKTADVDAAAKAVEASGGDIVKGPYDDAHERRAVVYDNKGNGLVFYKPLAPLTRSTYLPVRSRCLHPGQQHGRRLPSSSSSRVRRIRRCRVASCLASSTQQMNSLRAKGVMSFHAASAVALPISDSRRSAGSLCTTPPGIRWLLMGLG